ncbi:PBP1A family penicillin-binding protein [Vagococcus sp. BWB3-3]|uniref:PBP1A family penicillin-binding protein n=1 Tax=Vagococcus allomyrinae TaxID=2794353 RepID=A0A940P1R4_9ENTE|nr:PBP1A family penicillin-binding protein [Vagococcus allomyrinae]MBP1039859.1 PBP1A family penicillin-binding protein [Vagococcus allomyrinae]
MDFKKIIATIVDFFKKVWVWLKPYLIQFHQWRKRIWKKYQVNKIILLLGLVVVLVTSVYLFYLAKSSDVEALKTGLSQVTTIYDKDDEVAGTLNGQKGTSIPLEQMSPHLIDALISTEDKRFYQHGGFDIRGIGRAALGFLTSGKVTGGGSTLTQQLAKNAYLTLDQTLNRKAKELFLAIEIEKTYTKDEILEMYLNSAYFANGVWGVEDAAHKYFGTTAANLTIDEAAVMVGMLKGPGIYNPIDYYDNAIKRRDTVLQLMVDNGKLDQAQADQMMKETLVLADTYGDSRQDNQYPYFFDEVIREAERVANIKDADLLNKGYKVYTTLDQQYQQDMNTTFSQNELFPPNATDGEMVQGASIAINPKTGGVQAVVGGRGEHTRLGFNRATQSSLSPGSTMKPLVYTAALESGYQPDSLLKDEAMSFYQVENYDKVYRGEVPMYQALAESLNASSVWLLNEIGLEKGTKKIEKFGIALDDKDHYPGIVLGGMTKGTSPLKMASAYTVFANQGKQKSPHFIRKIVDSTGKIVWDNEEAKEKQITTPQVAEEMTSMLQGVFSSGTGYSAQPYGYTIAGKTGTTESVNVDSQSKDQWIIGYTPDVVVASWIGFDESSDIHFLQSGGGQGISPIFKDQTQRILSHSPGTPFNVEDASIKAQQEETQAESNGSLDEFGQKIKEGAEYWGGQIKDGAGKVKDGLKDLWNNFTQ